MNECPVKAFFGTDRTSGPGQVSSSPPDSSFKKTTPVLAAGQTGNGGGWQEPSGWQNNLPFSLISADLIIPSFCLVSSWRSHAAASPSGEVDTSDQSGSNQSGGT